jgi:nitrite reductase/ring-hydroxylating ferredoxin subunit
MSYFSCISLEDFEAKKRMAIVSVGRRQLVIVGGAEGEIYALDNRCPHEGYPLSKGTVDGRNVLTCNWHNWKFDLRTGKCLLGGDDVRVYPLKIEDGAVWVDPSEPPLEIVAQNLLKGFRVAFDKRQYGRMVRELARFHCSGLGLSLPVERAVLWSHDRFEFGTTHAYAALSDWLALSGHFADDLALGLACRAEAIDHLAFDALRRPRFPFVESKRGFKLHEFLDSIEAEDEENAQALLNGAFEEGVPLGLLHRAFSTAALAHYCDFGHSLIYVQKTFSLAGVLSASSHRLLLKNLVRSLCYSTREDLVPEFAGYSPNIEAFVQMSLQPPNGELASLEAKGAARSMRWLVEHACHTTDELFDHLLGRSARNLLFYDISLQYSTDNPVTRNVGWLDFTHGITFAAAVRSTCSLFPELWSSGLMQMACFYGRNAGFLESDLDTEKWSVHDSKVFMEESLRGLLDHGNAHPIYSAHYLKTVLAVRAELEVASEETSKLLLMGLNRFLHSPLKGKHVLRTVRQGLRLVEKDYNS